MMMSEEEFIESQKDCARMLGMTLEEYEESCKDMTVPKEILEMKNQHGEYDNSFLEFLGVTPEELHVRRTY